jgi:hypothetical protein
MGVMVSVGTSNGRKTQELAAIGEKPVPAIAFPDALLHHGFGGALFAHDLLRSRLRIGWSFDVDLITESSQRSHGKLPTGCDVEIGSPSWIDHRKPER